MLAQVPPDLDQPPLQPPQRDHARGLARGRQADPGRDPGGQPDGAARRRQRLRQHPARTRAPARREPYPAVLPLPVRPGRGRGPLPHAGRKGLEIIEGLRGHTSGYAVPTYVIDAPGGGGKIPVMPNYLISYSDHKVVLRNYEGYITTYEEPQTYRQHDTRRARTAGIRAPSRASPASTACSRASACGSSQLRAGPRPRQRRSAPPPAVQVGAIRRRCARGNGRAPLPQLEAGERERRRRLTPNTGRARSHARARVSRPRRPTGSCSSRPAQRAAGPPRCPSDGETAVDEAKPEPATRSRTDEEIRTSPGRASPRHVPGWTAMPRISPVGSSSTSPV